MTVEERIASEYGTLSNPTPQDLRGAIAACRLTLEELEPHLPEPSIYPYGRVPLFQSAGVEILVMNWAPRECAPHDHGPQSFGWVVVLTGTATHRVYSLDEHGVPIPRKPIVKHAGSIFFAPRGLIHSMGNATTEQLVTLHVYAPPIQGMKVYDLERCAACLVSDDCGAWWPDQDRQLLQVIRLSGS